MYVCMYVCMCVCRTGYTALIKAASLSRAHIMEALLDRYVCGFYIILYPYILCIYVCMYVFVWWFYSGANINHKNRLGKTALHYTVANGNIQVRSSCHIVRTYIQTYIHIYIHTNIHTYIEYIHLGHDADNNLSMH